MYKHDIHKHFTFLIFIFLNIFFIISTADYSNKFYSMFTFVFSLIGMWSFNEMHKLIYKSVRGRGFVNVGVRYFFILVGFSVTVFLVLLYNWILVLFRFLTTIDFSLYTVSGGFIWLVSYNLAKVFPNIPVMFRKEQ